MNEYQQLILRQKICLGFIKYLHEHCAEDPRYPEALAEYERQLESINSKIKGITDVMAQKEAAIELMSKVIKPAPTVIGLKTAVIFGKSKGE